MGKTYRRGDGRDYDDGRSKQRKGKLADHSSGKRFGGMKVVNAVYDEDDDFLDDVSIDDEITFDLRRD